jgi:hypothetical protein
MKTALALALVGVLLGLMNPASGSAGRPGASPDAVAAVLSYTGCLGNANLVQIAVGDIPANPPCRQGAVEVHFSGGDLTSLTAGTGLAGGGVNGDISIAIAPSFRLPQTCAANQGTTWNGSAWACASLTSQAAFDSLVSLLGSAGTINQSSNPVHWTKLKGVPAGFADGTDDAGPSYTAGFGLALAGTQFSVEPAQIQRRVTDSCAPGSSIRAIAQDGGVTCQVSGGGGASWGLNGNAGTDDSNYLGTSDNQPLNLNVNGQRALRLEPRSQSPNVIGGHRDNSAATTVAGATISGGGGSSGPNSVLGDFGTVGGGINNQALGSYGAVAGGATNQAGGQLSAVGGGFANLATADAAAISGGSQNRAAGHGSFVGAGFFNAAYGEGAVIPGGQFNDVIGDWSFAAGFNAHADDPGSFVWGDGGAITHSTGNKQFVVRAAGGLHLLDGQLFCDGCVTSQDIAPTAVPGRNSYCAHARANPSSFPDAPCRAHAEAVDTAGSVGYWTSIAIGTDGNPVISYLDATHNDLKVARCNDPICAGRNETLSTVDAATHVFADTSLAIGTDGNPVISYYDGTNDSLKVARCNDPACAGGDETLSTVDVTSDVGFYNSLEIGVDGNPVVGYWDAANGDLKIARCNDPACAGGDETLSTVDSPGTVGFTISLAIGSDGNPVVSYWDQTNRRLKVARCNDPACAGGVTLSAVDSVLGFDSSITIGTDGNPVVAYDDGLPGHLKVVRCNDPACANGDEAPSTVDTATAGGGAFISLAIGTDGNPVIGYYDGTTGHLKVARCNDAACSGGNEALSIVDSSDWVGSSNSLAISTDGNPVISYADSTNEDLKVARPGVSN